MTLASTLRKVTSRLMQRFGGEATIRRVTPSAYNTTTGTISETISDIVVRGVLEDINLREVNDLIQAGDKRLLIAAEDINIAPSLKDQVVIASIIHQVIQTRTIEQDNTAITYELILRA